MAAGCDSSQQVQDQEVPEVLDLRLLRIRAQVQLHPQRDRDLHEEGAAHGGVGEVRHDEQPEVLEPLHASDCEAEDEQQVQPSIFNTLASHFTFI